MKALFADLSEVTKRRRADRLAYQEYERRQVLALCDAVQVALANQRQDRVRILLREMHSVVDPALARRRRVALRMSA